MIQATTDKNESSTSICRARSRSGPGGRISAYSRFLSSISCVPQNELYIFKTLNPINELCSNGPLNTKTNCVPKWNQLAKPLPLKSFSRVKWFDLQAKKSDHLLLESNPVTIGFSGPVNVAQHPWLLRVHILSPKVPDGVLVWTKTCRA